MGSTRLAPSRRQVSRYAVSRRFDAKLLGTGSDTSLKHDEARIDVTSQRCAPARSFVGPRQVALVNRCARLALATDSCFWRTPGFGYGMSRIRPLARRAWSTFRPLRVAERARKPCVRARLRRLGLNVCFTVHLLKIDERWVCQCLKRCANSRAAQGKKTRNFILQSRLGQSKTIRRFTPPTVDNWALQG